MNDDNIIFIILFLIILNLFLTLKINNISYFTIFNKW